MIRCEIRLDVARAPSEVFAFVDDVSKAPRWLSRCASIEQTSPPPKGVGSTLRYTYRGGPGTMEGTVTAYQKDRDLAMRYQDRMFDVDVAFRFQPQGTGTTIEHSVAIEPKGFVVKLMSPMIRAATRKQIAHDTAMLKRLLEES